MDVQLETVDWLVLWTIVGARFLLPLSIPRYPLPGILASLVLDGLDQTLLQGWTRLPLEGYQGYDKALDIYYQTIAYVSTLRNWQNRAAVRVGRALYYARLVGVALFEITDLRWLLLALPNTFEYFFIFFEAYRARWDATKLRPRSLVVAAALIWIVIKLPQEYWVHIAQVDTTDWLKQQLFGVPAETPWSDIIERSSGLWVAGMMAAAAGLAVAWWLVARRWPPGAHHRALSADAGEPAFTTEQARAAREAEAREIVDAALVEKVVFIGLVGVSFAQVLPGVQATLPELALGLGLVVVSNTTLAHVLARRGFGWAFSLRQFGLLAGVNAGLMLALAALQSWINAPLGVGNALFFALLLALLVTLFDRYRQVWLMRLGSAGGPV